VDTPFHIFDGTQATSGCNQAAEKLSLPLHCVVSTSMISKDGLEFTTPKLVDW